MRRKLGYIIFITILSVLFIKLSLDSPNISANYSFQLPEIKGFTSVLANLSHSTLTPSFSKQQTTNQTNQTQKNVTSSSKKGIPLRNEQGALNGQTKRVVARKPHPNYQDYLNILNKRIVPVDLMKVVRYIKWTKQVNNTNNRALNSLLFIHVHYNQRTDPAICPFNNFV